MTTSDHDHESYVDEQWCSAYAVYDPCDDEDDNQPGFDPAAWPLS